MTIGARIKNRRKELGLTVEEVAKRLGKNRATVYRYESDFIRDVPYNVLEPLAKVLEMSPAELLTGVKDWQTPLADDSVRKERLLAGYEKLNNDGRDEAIRRIEEMTLVPRFTEVQIFGLPNEYDETMPVAAHHSSAADGHEAEALAEANKILRDDDI